LVGINEFFPPLKRALVGFVLGNVKKLIPKCPTPAPPLRDARKAGGRHAEKIRSNPPDIAPEDTAALQYTGGTTGVAKGAQ
ncbi:long-chain-fatty-acid--CoA ligase, partial [Enterococcus hirae]